MDRLNKRLRTLERATDIRFTKLEARIDGGSGTSEEPFTITDLEVMAESHVGMVGPTKTGQRARRSKKAKSNSKSSSQGGVVVKREPSVEVKVEREDTVVPPSPGVGSSDLPRGEAQGSVGFVAFTKPKRLTLDERLRYRDEFGVGWDGCRDLVDGGEYDEATLVENHDEDRQEIEFLWE